MRVRGSKSRGEVALIVSILIALALLTAACMGRARNRRNAIEGAVFVRQAMEGGGGHGR